MKFKQYLETVEEEISTGNSGVTPYQAFGQKDDTSQNMNRRKIKKKEEEEE